MKQYVLTQEDLDRLILRIDRNPEHGQAGGSSRAMTAQERQAHDDAHQFYNYQVRKWISEVSN